MGTKTDAVERYIYSTCMLGQGAKGTAYLFTVPRGQYMPLLGEGTEPLCPKCRAQAGLILTEAHTNVCSTGELGTAFGDAAMKTIRVVGTDLAADVEARLVFRVSGLVQYEAPLAPLLKRGVHEFKEPVLVARTDALEVTVIFDRPLTPHEVPTGTALLRVELAGLFARDVH